MDEDEEFKEAKKQVEEERKVDVNLFVESTSSKQELKEAQKKEAAKKTETEKTPATQKKEQETEKKEATTKKGEPAEEAKPAAKTEVKEEVEVKEAAPEPQEQEEQVQKEEPEEEVAPEETQEDSSADQAQADEKRRQQQLDLEAELRAENAKRVLEILDQLKQRKDVLKQLEIEVANKLQKIANDQGLTAQEKQQQEEDVETLKQEARNLVLASEADKNSLGDLGADSNQLGEANDSFETLEVLQKVIDELNLVGIDINFADIFGSKSKIPARQKLILPVRYKNRNLKIKVAAQDLRDHRKVRAIIESELQIQLLKDRSAQDEAYRLEQLRKLRSERTREQRESDYHPATATRDGEGLILPVQIR